MDYLVAPPAPRIRRQHRPQNCPVEPIQIYQGGGAPVVHGRSGDSKGRRPWTTTLQNPPPPPLHMVHQKEDYGSRVAMIMAISGLLRHFPFLRLSPFTILPPLLKGCPDLHYPSTMLR